jgi:hypothetical protein
MRRTVVVGVVLLTGLVLTAPAGAAKPSQTEKKLLAQVTALQKQVKTLQKQVKTLQTDVKDVANFTIGMNICATALTADAFQGTWAAINARETVTIFPPEPQINDLGACTDAKVTRAPTANPPTLTPFKALLAIFQSFG